MCYYFIIECTPREQEWGKRRRRLGKRTNPRRYITAQVTSWTHWFLDLMVPSTTKPYKSCFIELTIQTGSIFHCQSFTQWALIHSICLSCMFVDTEHIFSVSCQWLQNRRWEIHRNGKRKNDVRLFCGIGPSSCTARYSVPTSGTSGRRPQRQARSTQKVSDMMNNAQNKQYTTERENKYLTKDLMPCKQQLENVLWQ